MREEIVDRMREETARCLRLADAISDATTAELLLRRADELLELIEAAHGDHLRFQAWSETRDGRRLPSA